MSTEEIITSFWNELLEEQFDITHVATTILSYFGHDGHRLSVNDVIAALRAENPTSWRDIGWACQESFLGFDPDRPESKENFIMYVAMTCLWSDAVVRGHFYLDGSVDYIIQLAYLNRVHGSYYYRVRWFKYLFRESVT